MIHSDDWTRPGMAKIKTGAGNSDRGNDELRGIEVTLDFTQNALASLLYRQGETHVLVCITKAASLPRWFPRDADRGWVHAEYSLLPGSTDTRFRRERSGAKGRTHEIERLVARSMRGARWSAGPRSSRDGASARITSAVPLLRPFWSKFKPAFFTAPTCEKSSCFARRSIVVSVAKSRSSKRRFE